MLTQGASTETAGVGTADDNLVPGQGCEGVDGESDSSYDDANDFDQEYDEEEEEEEEQEYYCEQCRARQCNLHALRDVGAASLLTQRPSETADALRERLQRESLARRNHDIAGRRKELRHLESAAARARKREALDAARAERALLRAQKGTEADGVGAEVAEARFPFLGFSSVSQPSQPQQGSRAFPVSAGRSTRRRVVRLTGQAAIFSRYCRTSPAEGGRRRRPSMSPAGRPGSRSRARPRRCAGATRLLSCATPSVPLRN